MDDEVWNALEKEAVSNYDEIWKVNQQFLDEQILSDKRILLSNNPFDGYYFEDGAKRFYQRELDYLTDKGYTFKEVGEGLWEAIRK